MITSQFIEILDAFFKNPFIGKKFEIFSVFLTHSGKNKIYQH